MVNDIETITPDSSDDMLRSMKKKDKDGYPVYLMNEDYGIRGLDYGSPWNKLGICLLVLSAFSDRRSRIQGLNRVGRYKEACFRIQNSKANLIDVSKSIARTAKTASDLEKALKRKQQLDRTRP